MWVIIIYTTILACTFLATLKYPSTALAALLCLYGLKQWAQSVNTFFMLHGTLTNYLVGGIVITALVVMSVSKKTIFSSYPTVGWLTIALFLYSFVSIQWAADSDISYKVWAVEFPYIITVVLLGPLLICSSKSLSESLLALLPLGTLLVLFLLFTSNWTYRGIEIKGAHGQIFQGNPLAIAEMAGYVMSAVTLQNFRGKWRSWQVLRWLVVAACLALAAKSGSRGQFFTMIFATALFLPFSRKVGNPLHFLMLLAGVGVLAILGDWAFHAFSVTGDIRWKSVNIENDFYGRFNTAARLLNIWWESPPAILFGLGNSASFNPRIIGFYPHVVPLEILGEEGLLGFFLFLGIIILTIKSIVRTFVLARSDIKRRGLIAVLSAIFTIEFILSFKQGSMIGSPFLFCFIILLGKYELLVVDENKNESIAQT